MPGVVTKAVVFARENLRRIVAVSGAVKRYILVVCANVVWATNKQFRQRSQLKAAFNNMPQGLLTFDPLGRIVVVNQGFREMYGLSPAVVRRGCTFRELISHGSAMGTFSGDVEQCCGNVFDAIAQNRTMGRIAELPNGRSIRILNKPIASGGWVCTHEDITEQRRAEQDRDRNRDFLNLIIENVPVAICVKYASDRRYVLVNRACELLWGVTRGQILGHTAKAFFSKDEAEQIKARDDQLLRSTEPVCHDQRPLMTPANGLRIVNVKRHLVRSKDGKGKYLVGLIEDVTERYQAEERVTYLAYHDTVTKLPNRPAFTERLASVLDECADSGRRFAVLSIDLDRFKEVNDVFGHSVGDALLREVSRRLQIASGNVFLARVGGDEFMVIATDDAQPSHAKVLAAKLLAAVADEIIVEGNPFRISVTIGIAVYPADGKDAATLLANADAALYRAKTEARGSVRLFDSELDQELRQHRALQHDLGGAIERGELGVSYQPLAKLSGEIIGFEALMRWKHPIFGIVPPNTFVPLAEKSGLIISMGEWVLRRVCVEAASWPNPLRVAVNLSPAQFRQDDLPLLVHSVLLESGLPPNRLELEITEGVLIDDFSRGLSLLRRLKVLGVRIVMDDFGTGYSSLSYLHAFPFDKIKIDRLFISDLEHNTQSKAIVRAVIGLARGLTLPVAAEGVETEGQLAFLAHEGCDEVQGYLLGHPLPILDYAEAIGRRPQPDRISALAS
jgi:diguanylate cyclase (GGDEF)-like protein/PAS domain S-box-containing protein